MFAGRKRLAISEKCKQQPECFYVVVAVAHRYLVVESCRKVTKSQKAIPYSFPVDGAFYVDAL